MEVPVNVDRISAISTEGTLKKQEERCLLRAIVTKNTGIIIKVHILSSQNVSGAESVPDQ
jgi:hypothetical protein